MIVQCIHCQAMVGHRDDEPKLRAHALTCPSSPAVRDLRASNARCTELAARVTELEGAALEAVDAWRNSFDHEAGDRLHAAMIALAASVGATTTPSTRIKNGLNQEPEHLPRARGIEGSPLRLP